MTLTKKQYLEIWQEFADNIRNATPVDTNETADQKRERIKKLEKDPEAWFKWYFPDFATAPPAAFHKAATKRIMANPEWYEVRCWSRELAKSTRSMMEDLYLLLTKKKKYKILISCTYDSAELLMLPYKVNLETNNRINCLSPLLLFVFYNFFICQRLCCHRLLNKPVEYFAPVF